MYVSERLWIEPYSVAGKGSGKECGLLSALCRHAGDSSARARHCRGAKSGLAVRSYLVLVQSQSTVDTPLGPFGHIGVACASRDEIDAKVRLAEQEGVLRRAAQQSAAPVGYWAFFADPDGNTLELSYGQQIGMDVIAAQQQAGE
jgi:catechol 2,3-dioxygenase-like lactoylglutathione lyase family enzyme